jgi:hypothetical protein
MHQFASLFLSLGGSEGDRTLYLLHAMEALSQMSYRPRDYFDNVNIILHL